MPGKASTVWLMGIDSWLSIRRRTTEIVKGQGILLSKTPALAQLLMVKYGDDFEELQFSARKVASRWVRT
jgi:hypothetical protein